MIDQPQTKDSLCISPRDTIQKNVLSLTVSTLKEDNESEVER